jgi:ankyrin repeat protein
MEAVNLLLDRGADPNGKNALNRPHLKGGLLPLGAAAARGYNEMVRLLLEKGALINDAQHDGKTALYQAAWNGKIDTITLLLEHGADINARDHHGETPLFGGASGGRPETVRLLLDRGTDIHARNNKGYTILMTAACFNPKISMARMAANRRWDLPQGTAQARIDQMAVVKILIERGADVTAQSYDGKTAAACALANAFEDLFIFLKDREEKPKP